MAGEKEGIKVLIIDDEVEACDNLVNILKKYVEEPVNVLGVANDTREAGQMVKELNPEAVFLDIEMPEENAFQFLERISPYNFEIIFVTAFDQFAVKAFKLNAIDYMLKPICIDELSDAVVKLKAKLKLKSLQLGNDYQLSVLKQIASQEKLHKIALKGLNHIEVIDFKDIYFIEGQGSYCRFCYRKKEIDTEMIVSNTISEYEELIPSDIFYRIHKSYLVNCQHIWSILNNETCEVVTTNKVNLPVSRRRYSGFIDFLKENYYYSE